MTRTRLLVVEHQATAPLGHLGERLRELDVEVELVGPDTGREVPQSLEGYDGLIVLGGFMGPIDDVEAPWLPATRSLLAEGVRTETPVLGICLGAQLLATATGGHVRQIPEGPEVGLSSVTFSESASADALFSGFTGDQQVVQWHWLEADRLPARARVLASSPACHNQVFRIGPRAWGVQFHPEALSTTVREWARLGSRDLDALHLDGEQIVREVEEAETDLARQFVGVADRFTAVMRSATPTGEFPIAA